MACFDGDFGESMPHCLLHAHTYVSIWSSDIAQIDQANVKMCNWEMYNSWLEMLSFFLSFFLSFLHKNRVDEDESLPALKSTRCCVGLKATSLKASVSLQSPLFQTQLNSISSFLILVKVIQTDWNWKFNSNVIGYSSKLQDERNCKPRPNLNQRRINPVVNPTCNPISNRHFKFSIQNAVIEM